MYNEKYDRSKYQKAIGWVDERWGRVEKHDKCFYMGEQQPGFGLTGVTGYGESAKTHIFSVLFIPFSFHRY